MIPVAKAKIDFFFFLGGGTEKGDRLHPLSQADKATKAKIDIWSRCYSEKKGAWPH